MIEARLVDDMATPDGAWFLLPDECNVSADDWVSEAPDGPAGGQKRGRSGIQATSEGKRASNLNSLGDLRSLSRL